MPLMYEPTLIPSIVAKGDGGKSKQLNHLSLAHGSIGGITVKSDLDGKAICRAFPPSAYVDSLMIEAAYHCKFMSSWSLV